jgi:hypothetical protein
MAKRGTNEGSIFQRKDGRWVGSLNLGWEDGKRKRRHFYAATAAEVRDELLKARSDQSRGLPVSVERNFSTTGWRIPNSRANSLTPPKAKGSKHCTAWHSVLDFGKAKHSDRDG